MDVYIYFVYYRYTGCRCVWQLYVLRARKSVKPHSHLLLILLMPLLRCAIRCCNRSGKLFACDNNFVNIPAVVLLARRLYVTCSTWLCACVCVLGLRFGTLCGFLKWTRARVLNRWMEFGTFSPYRRRRRRCVEMWSLFWIYVRFAFLFSTRLCLNR